MKTIKQVIDSLARSPIKSTLTLVTVGLGVGVLILVLSMTTSIRNSIDRQLAEDGYVLMVGNAETGDEGQMEPVRPPEFDASVVEALSADVEGLVAATPVQSPAWQDFLAEDRQYRIRSAAAGSEQYVEVMGLELIAGNAFTGEDVTNGVGKALVTKTLATTIFGSPTAALGKTISIPVPEIQQSGGQGFRRRQFTPPSFVVSGVVADPSELVRKAYGIGDMIVPFTSILPQGINIGQMINFFYGTIAVRIQGTDMESAKAQIRDSIARTYGENVSVMIWEGTPQGESQYLADLRSTVDSFALVGNILGFVLLAVASIGIMSIMLVEAIGRTRDISLERALGASRRRIVGEYFSRSAIISILSAIVGTAISLALARPLTSLAAPIFGGLDGFALNGSIITLSAVATAAGVAALLGGTFGTMPVFSLLRTPIAEGLRDA